MQPTLNPHNYLEDYVFVSRWAVRNLDVERGDIVCLVSPKNPNDRLLKRIVGLQGTVLLLPYIAMSERFVVLQVTLWPLSDIRSHSSRSRRDIVGLKATIQDSLWTVIRSVRCP